MYLRVIIDILASEIINELIPYTVKFPKNQFWTLQDKYGRNYLHRCIDGKYLLSYIVDDMRLIKNHVSTQVWNELKSTRYSTEYYTYKDVIDMANEKCYDETIKQGLLDLLQ